MRRLLVRHVEGAAGAASGPAAVRRDLHRAGRAVDDAGLCGVHRRARRADRDRRPGPIGEKPRAHRALRRLAVLHRRGHRQQPQRHRPVARTGSGVDGAGDSGRLPRHARQRPPGHGAGGGRRHRLELGRRRAGLRGQPGRRLQPGARRAAGDRDGAHAAAKADRGADPRLVQPAARKPRLHDSRHRRAAAAGHHDEPVVDGHRPREGAGHARAAQRHAGHPLAADPGQAAAVRAHRADRRGGRVRWPRSCGSRSRCSAARGCCLAPAPSTC